MEVKMEEKEDAGENDGDEDYIKEEEGEEEDTKEEEEVKKTSGNNGKHPFSLLRLIEDLREGLLLTLDCTKELKRLVMLNLKTPTSCARNVSSKFLKDFELELTENIFFHDELERKWCGKVCNWKDGRTVIHGWADVCRWNHVKKDDVRICEFPQTEGNVLDIIKCVSSTALVQGAEMKPNRD
ncbi:hypothetical protein Patl1_28075 [Pistacia atlantica]|uniref:Uncharacterized protein n=1 Tax=Pistacia atlantica TaxID=434234 RepID=A0ACC1BFC0_9ROSI|nr:hypothetical protein Patl1_28075 [Pistacia atlantica]